MNLLPACVCHQLRDIKQHFVIVHKSLPVNWIIPVTTLRTTFKDPFLRSEDSFSIIFFSTRKKETCSIQIYPDGLDDVGIAIVGFLRRFCTSPYRFSNRRFTSTLGPHRVCLGSEEQCIQSYNEFGHKTLNDGSGKRYVSC